ncbi:hypothetical protein [Streptomyces sp. NPDC058371]|uniref:hypothetical protein n=1 Tax=Streptomyces sp. NPDC058371 TaxID=3346463 RepID=UPI003662F7E6
MTVANNPRLSPTQARPAPTPYSRMFVPPCGAADDPDMTKKPVAVRGGRYRWARTAGLLGGLP